MYQSLWTLWHLQVYLLPGVRRKAHENSRRSQKVHHYHADGPICLTHGTGRLRLKSILMAESSLCHNRHELLVTEGAISIGWPWQYNVWTLFKYVERKFWVVLKSPYLLWEEKKLYIDVQQMYVQFVITLLHVCRPCMALLSPLTTDRGL